MFAHFRTSGNNKYVKEKYGWGKSASVVVKE